MEWIGDLERAFAGAIYPNRLVIAIAAFAVAVLLGIVAWRRRWDRAARARPRLAAGVVATTLAIGLPLGWYLGSPLFLSRTIDEPPPVAAASVPSAYPASSPASLLTPPASVTATPPAPTPARLSGAFRGADDFHFGRGRAQLIETSPGTFTVRLQNFAVRNGPDLYVYLSPSAAGYAKGAVELGRLKADRGNQNYAVPASVDVTRLRSVVIWCRQFGVLFATAPLS